MAELNATGQSAAQESAGRKPDSGTIDKAKQGAGDAAHRAQEKASQAGQQARQAALTRADDRKHRLAEDMHSFGEALRLGSEQLRQRGDSRNTEYMDRFAGQIDRASDYLEGRNTREMMDEVERFARSNQALFLGGAFALGLVGARFLKSSRERDMDYETDVDMYSARDQGWTVREQTSRIADAERDSVGRPGATGYAPPEERTTSEMKAAGPRQYGE